MNSLEELNVYGTELEVDFADWRSADVILTDYNPADLNVVEITYYNNKVPNATEIEEIIQYDQCDVTYSIALGSIAGTITWPIVPSGCNVTYNESTNTYTIDGVNSLSIWNNIKNPYL
jgi:hypothetical protein